MNNANLTHDCRHYDVADVSKARTWLGSSEMKSVMEKSGVVGSPSIRFAAAA